MNLYNEIKHLAVIMDGNARWATNNSLLKLEGHRAGAETARNLISHSLEFKIPYLSLYAFSSENWQRPKEEIDHLIELLNYTLTTEGDNLHQKGIRLKVIGRLNELPILINQNIQKMIALTANNTKMVLCIAFSYGSQDEIVDACQKIVDSKEKIIDKATIRKNLYDPEMPDVDLLIRTGGEIRISNFLLWHMAYAELYFTPKLWPDFNREALKIALQDYLTRKRNFGYART